MSKLLVTRGLPASGKTTWAKSWVAEDPDNRVRVNRDDLRMMVFNATYLDRNGEDTITKIQMASVEAALRAGKDAVIDDTNLNGKFLKPWLKLAAKVGAEIEWHEEFLDVDVQTCIFRDRNRDKRVGDEVILRMNQSIVSGAARKRPELAVEDLSGHKPYHGTPGKPKAFLVDLDGTIATNGPDRDHPNRGYYEWHRVGEDLPVKVIIDIVRYFEGHGLNAIFVSGRDGVCFKETREWIREHVYNGNHPPFPLHMRPEGDMRKDSIVKLEIFDNEIRDNYDVQFALDDRQQVVDAYRSIGLTVLQCAPGDF